MQQLAKDIVENAMSYQAYRELIQAGLAEGKTTGPNQSPKMIEYTELNEARMRRLDKTVKPQENLVKTMETVTKPQIWLVITEAWCGDAAQIIPILHKATELNEQISLRLILRDEHPEVMDQFLTNGARAIPILIILDAETLEVLSHWGPRPVPAQEIAMGTKAKMLAESDEQNRKDIYQEGAKTLQLWYAKDRTKVTQEELNNVVADLND